MTRQEHLEFCKKCKKRKSDIKQGLLCGITGMKADFEETCENYEHDPYVQESTFESEETGNQLGVGKIDAETFNLFRSHQDFYYAIVGGLLASLISGVIWAAVTVSTGYQIGYMAIGVGLIVGYAVQFFGAGIDQKFGFLGAFLSVFGCLLGNLFSQVGFYAQDASLGYLEVLSYLSFPLIIEILIESFSPIDILFYGIAIYEGYKLAFRKISMLEISEIQNPEFDASPSNSNLRMPLVVVSIFAIGFFMYKVQKGVSGFKTYQYESGKTMSEGELVNSKEEGKWTFWYENGNKQVDAHFTEGIPDSLWQWYNESGNMIKKGHYKNGLEHGVWINYYENGQQQDSGLYQSGRMNGFWKFWYEDGQLLQEGTYKRNAQDGNWKIFHENGNLSNEGLMKEGVMSGLWNNYYDNGKLESVLIHKSAEKLIVQDTWDLNGKQLVKDGNGAFKSYSKSGQLLVTGEIKDGSRIGEWVTYFEDGKIKEKGLYENDLYKVIDVWASNGDAIVTDGNGMYKSYYLDSENVMESGKIVDGLREGKWELYYESTQTLFQDNIYLKGKQTGVSNSYFESGQLYVSGQLKDNKRDGEWNWYYESGLISSSVSFIDDKKDGKQTMWSEMGDVTKEEYYKNGELIEEKVF